MGGVAHRKGDAMSIKIVVTIQADKKHCCWCHHIKSPGPPNGQRWCKQFNRWIPEDKGKILRLQQCLAAEITE